MLGRMMVTTVAGLALVTATQSGTSRAGGRTARTVPSRQGGTGMCRHAPALAALPPETDGQRRQGGRYSVPPPVLMAPPPIVAAPSVDGAVSRLPPPAPAPGISADREAADDVIVTGARMTAPSSRSLTRRPYPGRPQPQSGTLTAGEHDDLLNPELYARYVAASDLGQRWRTLPRVDTGRALTIAVTDAAGRPLPLADVTLTCADGNTLSLATMADGTAVFFPELDRLGDAVRVSVHDGARGDGRALAADRRVAIPAGPGPQRVSVTTSARAVPVAKFDLLLMVDTTGSMGDEIDYLKVELRGVLAALKRAHPGLDLRIGLLFYRDVGDEYVTRGTAFTPDLDRAQALLRQQSADGGGDYPEAVDQAMNRAVHFDWRADAIKSMLFVADAPPHDDLVGKARAAAEVARAKRIQIVPVAASGVAAEAEFVMRAFAAATQSRYLFLTDDSGVGDAHAPPAIDCYQVTRLDAAVRRVLDSQISGRRIEPRADEVIRSVGQYDAGRCILPDGAQRRRSVQQ